MLKLRPKGKTNYKTTRSDELGKGLTNLNVMEMKEEHIVDKYVKQATENHAIKIDTNFWLVVKQKPRWMPMFIYKAVIKELVQFQEHRYTPNHKPNE